MRSAVLFDCIDLKGDGMITPTEAKRVFQQAHATSGSEFECLHLVSAACWMMTWFQSVSERVCSSVFLSFRVECVAHFHVHIRTHRCAACL